MIRDEEIRDAIEFGSIYTIKEGCLIIGCERHYIRKLLNQGKITAVTKRGALRTYIRGTELLKAYKYLIGEL